MTTLTPTGLISAQTPGGYRAHEAAEAQLQVEQQSQREEAAQHTLEALLDTYAAFLKAKGRRSHSDAESIFRLHVVAPFPRLASRPAGSITPREITDLMRRLVEDGKGRTANKLRSYVGAAFQCALNVDSLASIPASFRAFAVQANPVAATLRDAAQDRSAKSPLSLQQMRLYAHLLNEQPGIRGAALQWHLMTGGQRIEQLVKLKAVDVAQEQLTIFDIKGRPGQGPRRHTVPLLAEATQALAALPKQGDTWQMGSGKQGPATFVLSSDGGRTHISATTMSKWAQEIVETSIVDFQLKRVRSGVETLLASAKVSREIRGYLQSHGLTGIQHKHYDDHDYMTEKLEALRELRRLLAAPPDVDPG